MKCARNRPRLAVAVTAGALAALSIPTAVPVFAAVNDPVAAPRSIVVFPVRDMVSAEGYTASDRPTIQVLRGGTVIGTASNLIPVNGIVEVNHAGGGCWEGVTPDIRPGDVVRVLTAPDVGEQTYTANVAVTQPAIQTAPGTVVVKGTATGPDGARIPIDQLEARIVAGNQSFVVNGRRTLRASAAAGDDGTLVYDGAGNTWTATWTGLTGVSPDDGLSDADRATSTANESRGMWLGRDPGAGSEITIYEHGQTGGPAEPDCTAPLAKGPTVPDLTAASDTGSSNTDNITRSTTPTFTGAVALPDATTVNLYVDGVIRGTADVAADGSYSVTPDIALTNGRHTITASEIAGGIETMSVAGLTVTVDTAAPVITTKVPAAGFQGASQSTNVTATFNEPVAGVNTSSFSIKNAAGASLAAAVSWNATTRVATLNPAANLAVDARYTASLTAGIRDVAGNPLAATSFAFTTGPRPTVIGRSPAVNATSVSRAANITATTSERVTGVTTGTFALRKAGTATVIPAVVTYNATTRVATLNPNAALAPNTRYTATASTSIRDSAGNPLVTTSWNFTTGP